MTTQPTSTVPKTSIIEANNSDQRITSAESMRTVTISDNTRDYLIAIGKLDDLYSDICDYVQRDYGECQVDKITDDIYCGGLSVVRDKLFEFLVFSIQENIGSLDCKDI